MKVRTQLRWHNYMSVTTELNINWILQQLFDIKKKKTRLKEKLNVANCFWKLSPLFLSTTLTVVFWKRYCETLLSAITITWRAIRNWIGARCHVTASNLSPQWHSPRSEFSLKFSLETGGNFHQIVRIQWRFFFLLFLALRNVKEIVILYNIISNCW